MTRINRMILIFFMNEVFGKPDNQFHPWNCKTKVAKIRARKRGQCFKIQRHSRCAGNRRCSLDTKKQVVSHRSTT
jgi:hypothetical protein